VPRNLLQTSFGVNKKEQQKLLQFGVASLASAGEITAEKATAIQS
jgi:hypothetical protein